MSPMGPRNQMRAKTENSLWTLSDFRCMAHTGHIAKYVVWEVKQKWRARDDSNVRPQPSEGCTLSS
jgi:hypothetical protein